MPHRNGLRILLTNDDGIDSPGIVALEQALPGGVEVVVAAPAAECSACSHQVTTARPIQVMQVADRRFAVDSLPADCVRVAVHQYRGQFDWVLAGINNGANLGADVYYSGTVAAVREAALHGLPGIAFSHYRDRAFAAADWRRATDWVRSLLPGFLKRPPGRGGYWNVNLPSLPPGAAAPPVVECPVDTGPLQLAYAVNGREYSYTGAYRQRERQPGRDVAACFGGSISVSLLRLP